MAENSEMDGAMWSFGFGSNMDREALETKKHVKIFDEAASILKDWKFSFTGGIPHAEPAYANVEPAEGEEVHGLAFLMAKESIEELDRTESGYNKKIVTLHAYDGRELKGFVYTGNSKHDVRPSKRYMGVLIKGAKQAKLDPKYIEKLQNLPTNAPNAEALERRQALKDPTSLPQITAKEVAKHNGDNPDFPSYVGVLGYVFQPGARYGWFKSHKGRDVTTRMMHQFHGFGMDDNDDKGCPPYPLETNLTEEELSFVLGWQDFYNSSGPCIGYLKEYREQQESKKSDWKLP